MSDEVTSYQDSAENHGALNQKTSFQRLALSIGKQFKYASQQLGQEIPILFLKIVFLIFIGVYILTLPAYYFLVVQLAGDFLMPIEVSLCFVTSFVAFIWVFKMIFQLNRAARSKFS